MHHTLILLGCIVALMVSLLYVTNITEKYVNVATQVYCEQRSDFVKCSQEFREKTSELMRKR